MHVCIKATATCLAVVKGVAADDVTRVLDGAVVAMLADVVPGRSSPDVTVNPLAETNMVAAAGAGITLTLLVEEGVALTAAEEPGAVSAISVAGKDSKVVTTTTGAT